MFFGTSSALKKMVRAPKKLEQQKNARIVERENRLVEKAEADYIAEQEAKEVRQSKGLGSLITPARNESEEEIAAKKKKQGLGAVISSGGSTLG